LASKALSNQRHRSQNRAVKNGKFPSNSILNLYFGADRSMALEGEKPLSFYEGKDFKDIWLVLNTADADDDEFNDDNEPLVYQPPGPVKKKSPSNSSSKSPCKRAPKGNKSSTATPAADPSLKRAYDIMEGNAEPTITERMQHVGQTGSRLTKATEAGGGRELLQPHLKGRKSTSAVEMLDNLEDLEDEREEKNEALRQAIAGAKGGNGNETNETNDDDDDIPHGSESSFMADTFRSAKPDCF
jgi:hypothetical protein